MRRTSFTPLIGCGTNVELAARDQARARIATSWKSVAGAELVLDDEAELEQAAGGRIWSRNERWNARIARGAEPGAAATAISRSASIIRAGSQPFGQRAVQVSQVRQSQIDSSVEEALAPVEVDQPHDVVRAQRRLDGHRAAGGALPALVAAGGVQAGALLHLRAQRHPAVGAGVRSVRAHFRQSSGPPLRAGALKARPGIVDLVSDGRKASETVRNRGGFAGRHRGASTERDAVRPLPTRRRERRPDPDARLSASPRGPADRPVRGAAPAGNKEPGCS